MDLYRSMVPTVTDGNKLDQVIEDASQLRGMTTQRFQKDVLVPSLHDIAVTGNVEQFNLVASRLGPEFNAEVEVARTKFIEATNQQEKAIREEMDNRVGSISLAMDNGDPNATFAQQREIVNSYRGKVPESYLATKMNTIVREEEQFIDKQLKAQDQAFYNKTVQDISGMVGAAIDTGGVHLLAGSSVKVPQINSDARTVNLKDIARDVFAAKVQGIRERFGRNVNAADSAIIDLISKNPTMKDQQVEALFMGVRNSVNVNDTPDSVNKKPLLMASYDTFKRWGAKNPAIRDAHMSDEDRDFFSLTQLIEESSVAGSTPGDAMLKARDAMLKDPMFTSQERWIRPGNGKKGQDPVQDAFDGADFDNDAANSSEILRRIAGLGTVYMALTNASHKLALEKAASVIRSEYAKIGTAYVNIKGHPVAQALEMDRVGRAIVHEYLTANSIEDKAGTYSLTITPSGMWAITDDPEFRMVVPGSPVLSDSEIESLVKYVRSKGEDARTREAYANQVRDEIKNDWRIKTLRLQGTSTRTGNVSGDSPDGAPEYQPVGSQPNIGEASSSDTPRGTKQSRSVADVLMGGTARDWETPKTLMLKERLKQVDSVEFVSIPSVSPRLQPLIDILDTTPGPLNRPVTPRPSDFRQPSGRIDN